MSASPMDEMVDALLVLPEEGRRAFVAAQGWSPAVVVRSLKERSFALLERDPARALHLAEAGVVVAAVTDDVATRALAERGMAQALHASGRYAAAVERYDAAHTGFACCGEVGEAARTLIGKVDALMYQGRYAEAVQTAQTARAALVTQGDHRRAARVDTNLGNVFHRLDRFTEALAAYERARGALIQWGDDLDVALVDFNRGNVLAMLNRFDAALVAYAAAEATYSALGREAEYACTLYNEAYLHFLRGHYGHALAKLARVRALFTRLGDRRHLALCDLDEAEVLLALNHLCEAGESARRAAAAFDELAMRYEAAKARAFCAVAALEGGDPSSAGQLLTEAGTLFEQEGNRVWVATVRLIAATMDLRRSDAAGALRGCDEALAMLEPVAGTTRVGRTRVLRGQALRALGQHDAARADALAACADATALGDHALSYQAFHLLGRLQEDAGDLEGAAASFLRATDDVDWLRSGIKGDALRISFVRDKVALYEDAVRNLLRRDRVADAFEQVERAKARALVDLLASDPDIRIRGDSDDAQLARRVEVLRAELAGLYNRLHGEGEERQRSAEAHNNMRVRMRQYEDEITSALATLQVRQAEYVSLRSGSTASLPAVRQRLGAGDALLEYYLLGDEVIAFVLTDADVRVYGPLAMRSVVEELVQRWHFHLAHFHHGAAFARRHGARLQATALDVLGALHAHLVAPLAADLDGRALVIVPHGPLHHVPFHALYDGHTFLIERHEVSYAPSATVLALQRIRDVAANRALIVGVPNAALPHIVEEVEAVAACHADPLVLLGASATRAQVAAAAAGCNRVHLATHAIFRADNPLFSAVQLADDWLTVSDIYNLDLAADLVVLSACATGASAVLHGDELIGLTRGFLYAGARALVVSLWAANDAATAALMETFYKAIAAGASVRCAMRTAQRMVMASYRHPYYWAPFIAGGQVSHDRSPPLALV